MRLAGAATFSISAAQWSIYRTAAAFPAANCARRATPAIAAIKRKPCGTTASQRSQLTVKRTGAAPTARRNGSIKVAANNGFCSQHTIPFGRLDSCLRNGSKAAKPDNHDHGQQ